MFTFFPRLDVQVVDGEPTAAGGPAEDRCEERISGRPPASSFLRPVGPTAPAADHGREPPARSGLCAGASPSRPCTASR